MNKDEWKLQLTEWMEMGWVIGWLIIEMRWGDNGTRIGRGSLNGARVIDTRRGPDGRAECIGECNNVHSWVDIVDID